MKISQRVSALPTYVFARIGRRVRALQAQGIDVIRLDIGSPDLPPAPEVVAALEAAAARPDSHGYPGYYGLAALREAIAAYYARRFDVELDPDTEVLPLLGSKEGIYHAATAFVDPGDVVLVPDPGYPTYRSSVSLVGGELHAMPLLPERAYLPDLAAIPEAMLDKATVMWLNYPNNPTTAPGDRAFLTEAVAFAQQHELLILYDHAYAEITWGDVAPPSSPLEIDGARGVVLEFNSLSKMANMAGWRVGMAVGDAPAIRALTRIKTNVDSGIFRPVQEAAVAALDLPADWIAARNAGYQRRRRVVTRALDRMRIGYAPYAGTLYVWAEVPAPFEVSEAFATALLDATGVSVAPGTAFGAHGEGYVRISIVQPADRLEAAMERWERWTLQELMGLSDADMAM